MRVFLLRPDEGPELFLSGGLDESDRDRADPGSRGWLERKTRSAQAIVTRAGRRAGPWLRKARARLARLISPEETLLRGAFHAKGLRLAHPSTMSRDEVLTAWSRFLRRRQAHHVTWLTLNLLACPFMLVVAMLPGPNVLGYWFVYRAFGHAMAVRGARRLRSGAMPLELLADPRLDLPMDDGRKQAVAEAARELHGPRFDRALGALLGPPADLDDPGPIR